MYRLGEVSGENCSSVTMRDPSGHGYTRVESNDPEKIVIRLVLSYSMMSMP